MNDKGQHWAQISAVFTALSFSLQLILSWDSLLSRGFARIMVPLLAALAMVALLWGGHRILYFLLSSQNSVASALVAFSLGILGLFAIVWINGGTSALLSAVTNPTPSVSLAETPVISTVTLAWPIATPTEIDGFGPASGQIPLQPDDGAPASYAAGVDMRDFVAEARFFNPTIAAQGTWEYGLQFRQTERNSFHSVTITSLGNWHHILQKEGQKTEELQGEASSYIITETNQSNLLRLIALENTGWFFVNDHLMTTLDLTKLNMSGDVQAVAQSTFPEPTDERMRFQSFTVRPLILELSPTDGRIPHRPDNDEIEGYHANVTLRDFIAEAEFLNPYSTDRAQWSYGFQFRKSDDSHFHTVVVNSQAIWYHYLVNGDSEPVRLKKYSYPKIKTNQDGSNHLRIIVLGDYGWFFINDALVGPLDLSGHRQAGDILATTGYFPDNELAGEITQFRNLTIWKVVSQREE